MTRYGYATLLLCLSIALVLELNAHAQSDQAEFNTDSVTAPAYKAEDFKDQSQLICGWKKGKAKEAIEACEKLGFKIVGGDITTRFVVCEWKGEKLDRERFNALRSNESVRYVEPNFTHKVSPRFDALAEIPKGKEKAPVMMKDKALAEINKNKQLICAWRPRMAKQAIAFCEELGFKITGGDEADKPRWIVCEWGDKPLEALTKPFQIKYPVHAAIENK
ncbi:MAG: hypothetical protein ACYC3I_20700 [Gemmataceae bacterium]